MHSNTIEKPTKINTLQEISNFLTLFMHSNTIEKPTKINTLQEISNLI
jgi:hypothetical protein